jgi:hypothetical protein
MIIVMEFFRPMLNSYIDFTLALTLTAKQGKHVRLQEKEVGAKENNQMGCLKA